VEEIVGVVGHVKQFGLDQDAVNSLHAQSYESFFQQEDDIMRRVARGTDVFVRTRAGMDPTSVFPAIQHALNRVDAGMVVFGPENMEQTVADSIAQKRFSMTLLAVFAALALLLASIGIYGVLSYLVGQRTQEIGVRMALGAQRSDVLRLIMSDGARMALLGISIGIAAALGLTHLMTSMLFGVRPTDPLTFAVVTLVLGLIALLACYVPAHRAMRVDPTVALRYE
jgi:predicted lysophospholipase L1 biosynthesis ABC-type transport system permease subunit